MTRENRGQPDKDEALIAAYEESVGHPPHNLATSHPDHWQWAYGGTKKERAKARKLLGLPEEDDVVVIEGQLELL